MDFGIYSSRVPVLLYLLLLQSSYIVLEKLVCNHIQKLILYRCWYKNNRISTKRSVSCGLFKGWQFTFQISIINYRPKTKFAKVMFLHLSVCPRRGVVSRPRPRRRLGGLARRVSRPRPRGGWGSDQGGGWCPGPYLGGGQATPGGGGVSRHMPGGSRLTPRSVQVHTRGGAGCVQAHAWGSRPRGVQVHTRGCPGPYPGDGGCVQAHAWGGPDPGPGRVSRPRPRGVYHSMHWGRHLPPIRQLLLRAVRILLECILVYLEVYAIYGISFKATYNFSIVKALL